MREGDRVEMPSGKRGTVSVVYPDGTALVEPDPEFHFIGNLQRLEIDRDGDGLEHVVQEGK